MYGLFYPAVLGTFIVGLASSAANDLVDSPADVIGRPEIHLALIMMTFYTASFATEVPDVYTGTTFAVDAAETLLMFVSFFLLAVLKNDAASISDVRYAGAVLCLIGALWLQTLWRWSVGAVTFDLGSIRVMITVLLLADGAFQMLSNSSNRLFWPIHAGSLVASGVLITRYALRQSSARVATTPDAEDNSAAPTDTRNEQDSTTAPESQGAFPPVPTA